MRFEEHVKTLQHLFDFLILHLVPFNNYLDTQFLSLFLEDKVFYFFHKSAFPYDQVSFLNFLQVLRILILDASLV